MKRKCLPDRESIRHTLTTGLLRVTLLLIERRVASSLMPMESYEAPSADDPSRDERPWIESYTMQQEGRCQVICSCYGNLTKCREYCC